MPDKVYVVTEYDRHADHFPIAVFADKDDAEKFIAGDNDLSIVEVPYNP